MKPEDVLQILAAVRAASRATNHVMYRDTERGAETRRDPAGAPPN